MEGPELTPHQRANELLLTHLNPFQQTMFRDCGCIRVTGSRGGSFCIHAFEGNTHTRVFAVTGDHHVAAFCSFLAYYKAPLHAVAEERRNYFPSLYPAIVPAADEVLAHKLFIESREEVFRRVAHLIVAVMPCVMVRHNHTNDAHRCNFCLTAVEHMWMRRMQYLR